MPKAKKNDHQDCNISSKNEPPNDGDVELKKRLGLDVDEEVDIDVKELVRRYEENDIRDGPEGPDGVRNSVIELDVKEKGIQPESNADQENNEKKNLGPSLQPVEQQEEEHENPTFQPDDVDVPEPTSSHHKDNAPEPPSSHHEEFQDDDDSPDYIIPIPEPAPFQREIQPFPDRGSSEKAQLNRQRSNALPVTPAEFDAAAARERSRSTAVPPVQFDAAAAREAANAKFGSNEQNQRSQVDALPAVPGKEMTAPCYDDLELGTGRKSGNDDYRTRKDTLPAVPRYDQGDDIAAEKRKAADKASHAMSSKSKGNMGDFVAKAKSKSNRTVVILVASALVVLIIVILFMIIYFATGPTSLPRATIQPTDARPPDTGGSVVIVGVNLDATVRLSNRAFIPQYNNDLSPQYKSLADNFTNTMDDVFYGSDLSGVYNGTHVNGFSPGSVIVDFVISLLSPPVLAPGDMTTPAGSLEDRLKQVEEEVTAAVQEVIEEAADDGGLDDLGVDATSFVVIDVGVDVRVITEAPTTSQPPQTMLPPDTSSPAIMCPWNMIFYFVPPDASANVTWLPVNVTDDSGQVTVTTDMEQGLWDAGDYVIVVTAVDPAGNMAECSFNVTVKEDTPPAVTCPQNMIVYLVPPDQSANVTWPPINATDDSGQVTVTTDMEQGLWDAGDYVIVVTAVDPAGNIDDCSFNVTVKDRTCPPGWLRRSDSCYRLAFIDPLSYADAVQICAGFDENAPGAYPFIPNDHAEYDFAAQFLLDIALSYIWIGCGDVVREGRYDCIDGTKVGRSISWWAHGEPNQGDQENCIALIVQEGKIHDVYCLWQQPNAFCEIPAQ